MVISVEPVVRYPYPASPESNVRVIKRLDGSQGRGVRTAIWATAEAPPRC